MSLNSIPEAEAEGQPLLPSSKLKYPQNNLIKSVKKNKKWILTASLLTSIVLVLSLNFLKTKDENENWPKIPKVPAHVPFLGGATWNPHKNETITATNGAVSSDLEICSELGVDILRKGGFAADAAVSTCLCIGALNTMYSSGIGGGAFITSKRHDEDGAISIDAREMAPGLANRDMFEGRELYSKFGGLAVGIPGELKGLYNLFKMHGSGKVTWEEIVMPVADLARNGFEVNEGLAFGLQMQRDNLFGYKDDWSFAIKEDGNLVRKGDILKRPKFAETLTKIAQNGSDAIFYDPESDIVKSIVMKVQQKGGILTEEDFGKYNVVIEDAIKMTNFTSRNLNVFTSGGSSSGVALIAGLQVMNEFTDLNDLDESAKDFSPVETQRLIETMKWMAAVRSNLGDLGIYNRNETSKLERDARYSKFLSLEWSKETNKKINDDHTLDSWRDYHPAYQPNDPHGTSHLNVIDKHGNAVAITTTVNLLFGSLVHDPETGIILNDEMDDFSLPTTDNAFGLQPSIYNYIEPYKRPLSSTTPTIIVDPETNKVDMVIGAAGGSRITTAVLQAIVRTYHYKLSLLDTIAFPRLHHQLLPEIAYIEKPIAEEMAKSLIVKGHVVEFIDHLTAMNGIKVENDTIFAQSDYWRKLGRAAGY